MRLSLKKQKSTKPNRRRVMPTGRSAAFSYHANRNEQEYTQGRQQPREQDARTKAKVVRYWRQRLGMLFAGLVLIVCVVNALRLDSTPQIVALTPAANDYFLQSTAVYQAAAAKLLQSSIANTNKITIDSASVTKQLKQQFPELSDVSVTLPLISHRPIIYVAPTMPTAILATPSGTYILDTSGKALIAADNIADISKLQLPTVTDQSGLQVKAGTVALPSSSVTFIKTIADELKAKNVSTDTYTLPSAAYELDIKPKGVGYYIKFNLHGKSALQQVGTYLAMRHKLEGQSITPSSYIDVRLDGRAYYK